MRRRLADARVGHLATVTAEGRPHVVPCCFVLDGDTVYTAVDDVKPKATPALRRLANIAASPAASLLVDHYDEDWAALWWVRVDGRATVRAQHRHAVDLLVSKYEQYRRRPPPGPVIMIEIERWRAWP